MAHEITQREDGTAEFAFTGSRSAIWHGLGAELQEDSSIETWKTAAGMDWDIFESKVIYESMEGQHVFPDKRVLFRSDTKKPLSVVSGDYKIVQPSDVLEFFRDLVNLHDMKLSTAGTLFGGKRFWALAELGKEFNTVDDDKIQGNLLLVTSVDGSLATQARFVSTRVVCNNTMTVAMSENSKHLIKKSHRSTWDPESIKIDLGLVDASWSEYMANIKKLSEIKVTDSFVQDYFQKKFYVEGVPVENQGWGAVKKVNQLIGLYNSGAGAEYSNGTMYGMLNAATELFTHGSGKRNTSHQFWNSQFGNADTLKSEVYNDLLAMSV